MNKYQEALKIYSYLENENTIGEYTPLEYQKAIIMLQELVEKENPKELDYEGDGYFNGELVYDTAICRSCCRHFEIEYEEHYKYCPSCGQRLDWSDEE